MIEALLKKKWSFADIQKYIGNYHSAYLSYSKYKGVRTYAASGGTISSLLLCALEQHLIDGAVVCKTAVVDGSVRANFIIAKTKTDILSSQGSKYVQTHFAKEAVPLIKPFEGKLAVVGLPCDISLTKRMSAKYPLFEKKIAFTIALICGHNSQPTLIDTITTKLEQEAQSTLIDYKFRIGHWRGKIKADFKDGTSIEKKSLYFNLYHNLNYFSQKKCLYCFDHFGYNADITAGDIWSYVLRKHPIKHSSIIVKTERGCKFFDKSVAADYITAQPVQVSTILDGQARIAPFHYNISARHRAGKLLGIAISDQLHEKVSWHEFIVAFIILFNWKWSQNRKVARLIFKLPKLFHILYLYMLKGLESLK
jgi:coenzyme F420-reducing hydrogenase beta subunit